MTQKLTEKTIGMVDVPLLTQPNLKQRLSGHSANNFDYAALEKLSSDERSKIVLVLQDPFTSYYDASVVEDLVRVIEALGYRPQLLPFTPNGKAQHIKGFLGSFEKTASRGAKFLNHVSKLGIPIVGPDPAMVLCYRTSTARR